MQEQGAVLQINKASLSEHEQTRRDEKPLPYLLPPPGPALSGGQVELPHVKCLEVVEGQDRQPGLELRVFGQPRLPE